MQLRELFDYKNLLVQTLCSDEEIVKLVTGKDDPKVPNHELPYTQIFPYEYVPETVAEGNTFICLDVDVISVPNKTTYALAIYIWIFTHKSRMRKKDGGILTDAISSRIESMLGGNRFYGLGALKLNSVTRFAPITDYLGRCLVYYTKDFNQNIKTIVAPANRLEDR